MDQALLSEEDGRRIVRLMGEAAGRAGEPLNQQRRFLMDGLAKLVGADFWLWGHYTSLEEGKLPAFVIQIHGGFTTRQFSDLMVVSEHPDMAVETAPLSRELARRKCALTRLSTDIVDMRTFGGSDLGRAWQRAGLQIGILSCTPFSADCTEVIGLYRRHGVENFVSGEARIAHILLSEVPWLHVPLGGEASEVASLTPRQHSVLNLMVSGKSRTEIAEALGLSTQTVVDYQKDVYAHFGVHSQPGLMARFLQGNGGDR